MTGEEGIKPSHQPVSETPPPARPDIALSRKVPLAVPGAGLALGLLLGVNLFNYIDRQVLRPSSTTSRRHFLPPGGGWNKTLLGLLATAFLVSYMIFCADLRLAGRPHAALVAGRHRRHHLEPGQRASGLASYLVGMARLLAAVPDALLRRRRRGGLRPGRPDDDLRPVPGSGRGQVLSWFYAAIPVGSALGYTLGGRGRHWPLAPPSTWSCRPACCSALLVLLHARAAPRPDRRRSSRTRSGTSPAGLPQAAPQPLLRPGHARHDLR